MRLQCKFNLPPLLILPRLNWACPYHAYPKRGFAESVKHFEEKGTNHQCYFTLLVGWNLCCSSVWTALIYNFRSNETAGKPFSLCNVSCSPLSLMPKIPSVLPRCLSLKLLVSVVFLPSVNNPSGKKAQRHSLWHKSLHWYYHLNTGKIRLPFSLCVLVLWN